MTEQEWNVHDNPAALLCAVKAPLDIRKFRLYLLAFAEHHRELLTPALEQWLTAFQAIVDGTAPASALDVPEANVEAEFVALDEEAEVRAIDVEMYGIALGDREIDGLDWLYFRARVPSAQLAPVRRVGAALVRDIFGNPFRPVAFDPAWRTSDAVALARSMYDSRNFGAMPILADALQDAGCDSADVLNHCRDANQVHVRGCWVCDLVLGKE